MIEKAIFAGGCFWCMEPPFKKMDGVLSVMSGYIAGHKDNPTYQEVCSGLTGHTEAIEVTYNSTTVSYEDLLAVFWVNIDPTDAGGQFVDRGSQYRTGIYYLNEAQKRQAEASKVKIENSGRFEGQIMTEITAATKFFQAEEYHQNYYATNPVRYKLYRSHSGRDSFLRRVWGDKNKS